MSRGRRFRLSGEASRYRSTHRGLACVAASLTWGWMMNGSDKANILLVDDQPAKLMTYEVVLEELGENLIKALSAREALECLLRNDIAVILMDVSMPELDGFQLAAMIREHPRYRETAIIFVSAVHLSEADYVRGYQMGAVDYVSAPVV